MSNKKVFFKTFGCKTNIFDTQVMVEGLKDFEIATSEDEADILVVNSCSVTNSADNTLRSYINRFKQKEIYLTGCSILGEGKKLYEKRKIRGVFAHSSRDKIDKLLKSEDRFFIEGDRNYLDNAIVSNFEKRSRAFIKIQEGCDFECSYCIIPTTRGRARSKKESNILKQIDVLVELGFEEVVLCGTNVGSYGIDIESSLDGLIKKILLNSKIKRVRVGSLEPSQVNDGLVELMSEEKMAKHLHIALQHTSDKMLEIMNRKNRFASDSMLFDRLAQKGIALGSDFIVGHPGESECEFEMGRLNLKELPITHIHLFSFSKRDGTKSSSMKIETPKNIAQDRIVKLNMIVKEKNIEFRKNTGKLLVHLENGDRFDGEFYLYRGYDEYYNKALIKSKNRINTKWINIEEYMVEKDTNIKTIF